MQSLFFTKVIHVEKHGRDLKCRKNIYDGKFYIYKVKLQIKCLKEFINGQFVEKMIYSRKNSFIVI